MVNLVASLAYPARKQATMVRPSFVLKSESGKPSSYPLPRLVQLPFHPFPSCLCLVCIRPVPAQAIKTAWRRVQQLEKPMDCREPQQQLRCKSVETHLVPEVMGFPPNHPKSDHFSRAQYISVLKPVVFVDPHFKKPPSKWVRTWGILHLELIPF